MNEPMTASEVRQPQMGQQFDRLNHQIERLQHLESAVRERLSCVLRSEPSCKGEGKDPEETLVPLADHVREIAKRATRIADGFEEMLGAIEL